MARMSLEKIMLNCKAVRLKKDILYVIPFIWNSRKWKLIYKTGITESYYKCAFNFQRIFHTLDLLILYIVSFSLVYFFSSVRSGYSFINFWTYSFKVVSKRLFECILYWELNVVSCRQSRADLSFFQVKLYKNVFIIVRDCFVLPLSWKIAHLNLAEAIRYFLMWVPP